jgi:predicted alpha/beta-fold hydrolase
MMAAIGQPFVPAWWCRSGHAQTIYAAALRPVATAPARRERWEIPDGDFLDVDHVPAPPGRPILILLHGLEASSRARPVQGFLAAAHQRGWRGLGVNFRSCSGELNRLRRCYHSGDTSDLDWVIRRLCAQEPQAVIVCVGLSLGGNVLLKYLGEQGDGAPRAVKAAVAVSAPFDLASSARAFEAGFLNRFYGWRLVRSLKRKTLAKLHRYPDLADPRRFAAVRTIGEFDEVVTAPVHGFAGAQAYWSATSCRQFLPGIRRPTLLINSTDDPLVLDIESVRRDLADHPYVAAAFQHAGGHLGFIGGPHPGRPTAWAERAALSFLMPFDEPEAVSATIWQEREGIP